MAKKHAPSSSKQTTGFPSFEQEFSSYYSPQQHRRKEHGAKQRKPSDTVAELNKIVEEEGVDSEGRNLGLVNIFGGYRDEGRKT